MKELMGRMVWGKDFSHFCLLQCGSTNHAIYFSGFSVLCEDEAKGILRGWVFLASDSGRIPQASAFVLFLFLFFVLTF